MADALILDFEKRYPGGSVVRAQLEVALEPGSVLVLFGPSGAGKTTIVRALAGLERPDRGTIHIGNQCWFDAARRVDVPPQQRRVGCVFQQVALFPHLTVRENVGFGLNGQAADVQRVDELLALTGVDVLAARYPRTLSGGQAQRVALARALAPSPRLLMLDEPFGALDTPTRRALRAEFRRVTRTAGIPTLLVTHDRAEAIAVSDTMAVVEAGGIRQVGPTADVLRRPADASVAHSLGVETVIAATIAGADQGLLRLQLPGGGHLRAVEQDARPVGSAVFACIRAEDVSLETAPPSSASIRNHIAATVVAIESEGAVERVTLDCGFPLVAIITRSAREDLALAPGSPCFAAIKATLVHVVPKD